MAKNDNLTDFMTDLANAIREAEHPYIERVLEEPDLFTDHMPQNVDNTPMYMGNWELGCYNCDTGEYIQYSQYEADGNWLTHDENVWGNYSGFGVSDGHAHYLDFGGALDATYRPCICYTAPKAGRVKLSLTKFENVQGWQLSIYVNGVYKANWNAGDFTQDEINTFLGNIDFNLSKGDVVRFVATRTGENWHCKMVPAVQYEVVETINPQDFEARVQRIPALISTDSEMHLVIPDYVETITNFGFNQRSTLKSVVISNKVKMIGEFAFQACRALESVTFNDDPTITTIGRGCFNACTGLKSIVFPDTISDLQGGALIGCSGLESVTLPKAMTALNKSVLAQCQSLTAVTIPENVTEIRDYAMAYCYKLQTVKILSSKVETMSALTFDHSAKISDIYVPWAEGEVANAPWGAKNAIIHYNYTEG